MDWTTIGVLAEATGAIGVIASLVYLARQVRAGAHQAQIASYDQIAESFAVFSDLLASNAEVADIFWRGLRDAQSLDDVERLRFYALLNRVFRSWERAHHYHRTGDLTPWAAAGTEQALIDFIAYPGFQQWWRHRRHWYHGSFVSFVDAQIGEAPARLYAEQSHVAES